MSILCVREHKQALIWNDLNTDSKILMGEIMGLSLLLAVYLCYYAFLSRMRREMTPTISEAIIASRMKADTYFGAT